MKMDALWLRARVIKAIRDFFWQRGFLEVETPLLIPANAPEEHINPIFALPSRQLQTSPEICMKRLLCGGHHKLFQISHCWRAEERGSRHLSEFTMLEWYRVDFDYQNLMNDCKDLLQHVSAICLPDRRSYRHNGLHVDPFLPWQHITVQEAFLRFGQVDVLDCLRKGCYEEILTGVVEPALARFDSPVIMKDYPVELAALARTKPDDPELAERFELYVGGLELANGFSELTDPIEQRHRFEEANTARRGAFQSELPLPERFLEGLATMPPSAGIALGVDRLVMLTAGADCIDEVVAFTPEEL
ncbi:MAG: EF-P lysine aminoacylase EpmA [Desulfuromonadaceae bacterium]|nr:EF-P lysine aminoacylase EpmA [Desulfuromonadaceae bacterium]MDD5105812.1 EF-P lysine aminoacylase EpmA [Desulfuromonadaceae bacterium]